MTGNQNLAEQSVIGSVLIDPDCLPALLQTLKAEDFENEIHRSAFEAARDLYLAGETVDVVVILDHLRAVGKLKDSTQSYFLELMNLTPTAANVMKYAAIVREQSRRRAVVDLTDRASTDAMFGGDLKTVLGNLHSAMEQLSDDPAQDPVTTGAAAAESWRAWIAAAMQDPGHAVVKTGFWQLDAMLGGGFFKTGFYVIGARPGMGKTTCSLNLAESIAKSGKRVLYLSLEMDKDQITTKRLSIRTGISYTVLYNGQVPSENWTLVAAALQKIESCPFDVVDSGVNTVAELGALLRLKKGYDVVFVDYLGLLSPAEEDAQKSKYDQVSNLSKNLKALAKSLHIPIVAMSQLNRESQSRQNKRPSLSDLRDSGSIEQDADGVILLHREGYYAEEKPSREEIELIVAKNRHDRTGTVRLMWDGSSGTIYEMTDREE